MLIWIREGGLVYVLLIMVNIMNNLKYKSLFLGNTFTFLIFSLLTIVLINNPVTAANQSEIIRPAFTDPNEFIQPKKDNWINQAIKYPKAHQKADIFLALDQQLYPSLLPLINQYAKKHQLKIDVKEGTCGISSGMLGRKQADIGGYCCPPGRTDRLPGLKFHTLGISSIAVFVHPANQQIKDIKFSEIQGVFSGEIQRWNEVNNTAPENLIHPVGRLHCKLRPGHWRLLLENEEMFSPRLNEVSSIPDMISSVANDINAIGYETLWMVQNYKNKGQVKWLKIDGVAPNDSEALAKGNYPIYRTFNITSWESESDQNPKAQELVKYLVDNINLVDDKFELVPLEKLRQYGWEFLQDELIGEPKH